MWVSGDFAQAEHWQHGAPYTNPADKEAKVGKSDAEDKENVNYVLVNIAVHSSAAGLLHVWCGGVGRKS